MLARRGEPLRDHLLNVALVARRLSEKLKLDLDREAYLAGLLHDLGKADAGAQLRIAQGSGSPGHELLSAVVALEILRAVDPQPERRFVVTAAIMRHHTAMRDLSKALKDIRSWLGGTVACHSELVETLSKGLRELGLTAPSFSWPAGIVELEERIRRMQEEFDRFYSSTELSLRARLLTGVLMVADTYVAGEAAGEGEEKSLYKHEVRRFARALLQLAAEAV